MTKTSGLPRRNIEKTPVALDSLLDRVLAGIHGEEEQICALRRAFEEDLSFPTEALVIDEPVSILEIEYDGKRCRGLTARCRGGNGAEHSISVSDLVFPMDSLGASYVSAYRTWQGMESTSEAAASVPGMAKRPKATGETIRLGESMDLVVLSIKEKSARCRIPDGGEIIGLEEGSRERKDYEITRNAFRKSEDERSHFYQRLYTLVSAFLGWLHREKGMSYTRASLVRMDLLLFLVERLDGDLRNIGFLNQAPYKKNPSIQILVPDRENLEDYLDESFSSVNLMFYRGMALLEGIPYWLEFLTQRRFLDEDSHRKIFKSLSILFQKMERLWEENGMENDIDIPAFDIQALKRAWSLGITHQNLQRRV